MSYPPMSNYYGSDVEPPNDQRQYGTMGSNATRPNMYHAQMRASDDGRQSQYHIQTYGWTGQSQNAAVHNAHSTYASDSWNIRANTSSAYNYQRDPYTTTNQGNTNGLTYQSRDPYNSQNTQGLNHLAYASGLDSSSSQLTSAQTSQPRTGSAFASSTSSRPQAGTSSPAPFGGQYASGISQPQSTGPYSGYRDSATSEDNSALAVNAAAALADAVRNRHQYQGSTVNTLEGVRASTSPLTRSAQPRPTTAPQQANLSHNTKQPVAEHIQTLPKQSQSLTKSPSQSRKTAANKVMKSTLISETKRASQPTQPMPSSTDTQRYPAQIPAQASPMSSNPQSIANLVSNNNEPREQISDSIDERQPIVNFIDPTQVFNPYHREHERKKREAAEAEARRKAEEQRIADEEQKTRQDAAKQASELVTATNNKSKVTKKATAATTGNTENTARRSDESASGVQAAAPSDDSMAAEMQKMMSKLKEYRSTNPALFHKVWNDMKGSAGAALVPVPTISDAPMAVTQSPVPEVAKTPTTLNALTPVGKAKTPTKKPENISMPSGIPSNGFKVTIENNEEGLPDLGRFPAERRIRTPYAKQKLDKPTDMAQIHIGTTENNSQVQKTPVPTPARPADPTTAWPEPRRRAVAIAAINLLKSYLENASTTVTAQDLNLILERNPSYTDLCNELEYRGLKLKRTTFARELLKSVPELQTPPSKITPSANKVVATISAVADGPIAEPQTPSLPPVSNNQNATQPILNVGGSVKGASVITQPALAQPTHMHVAGQIMEQEQKNPPAKPITKTTTGRTSMPSRPEPPVGSKEAAARKRDFSELIDLTELNDNENYVIPTKQPRLETVQPPDPFKQVESSLQTGFSSGPAKPLRFDPQPQLAMQSIRAPLQPPVPHNILAFQSVSSGIQHQNVQSANTKNRMILAKKIDRSEALKKSYYNPKTIARDILIASGRHPSERPLNLHLAGMLNSYIDLDSDVSTFDWETVDPGGPPPAIVEYVDIPAVPPRFKLGERVRKRARMTEIEEGHEPHVPETERRESRRSSAGAAEPQGSSSAQPSPRPTSTSRRDQFNLHQILAHRQPRNKDEEVVNKNADGVTPSTKRISINIPVSSSSTRSASQPSTHTKSNMEDGPLSTGKKRGRPPGSKNKYPSITAMKQQAKTAVVETTKEVQDEVPEPVLHSYKCKWVKCHAELHNIDTLRRHVLKKHIPGHADNDTPKLVCWWKKCRYLKPDGEGNMISSHAFKDQEEWASHIDEDHIHPIAIKYGDGPKTSQTGKPTQKELDLSKFLYKPPIKLDTRMFSHLDSQSVNQAREQYLADANGRATTPLISPDGNSEHPFDAMVLMKTYPHGYKLSDKEKADITAHNAFMKAHGNKHKDVRKAAEEVVRAMEVRKKKIGPGIDRGGCTLINEARRTTFMQAPGISRVIDTEF